MKRSLLALSIAAGILSISQVSYAAVPGSFDLGIRGGWAHTNFSDNQVITDDDDNGFGVGINFGYNFDEWFGIELGYNYFDGFSTKYKDGSKTADYSFHGPELAARFAFPLGDDGSDIYIRAGGMVVIADNDDLGHDTKLSPLLGVGIKYAFTKSFSARLGYDYYFDVYDDDDGDNNYSGIDSDIGFLYLGFNYTFGFSDSAPAPVEAQASPGTTTVSRLFALDAGALFPFDGSNLTEQGAAAVDDVVAEVNANNVTNVTYTVTGYTDRLGSDEYNQKLSERRAEAVAQRLITSGVEEESIISVEGFGKADPVTGNSCDGLSRNELIKCLAPDRRVEIQVEGDIVEE